MARVISCVKAVGEKCPWNRLRAGLLAALGAVLVVAFWWNRTSGPALPMGGGPAGPSVPAEPFQAPWRQGRLVLLGMGDSITRGLGAPPGRGYFDLLAAGDGERTPDMRDRSLAAVLPGLEIRNESVSYSASKQHLEIHLARIEPYPPDVRGVVVITTGGNDLIHNYGRTPPADGALYGAELSEARPWSESFRVRLKAILAGLKARFPGGCEIFLANLYDPTDSVGDIENGVGTIGDSGWGLPRWPDGLRVLHRFNRIIGEACDEDPTVHLVDLHALFLGHGIHCREFWRSHYDASDPHYWYFGNLEDPNERGHDAIRRAFLLEMVQILRPLARTR